MTAIGRAGTSWAIARRSRVAAAGALAAAALCVLAATSASGDVSHAGWPRTATVWFADNAGQTGVGTDGNDMLLGGPGSDTIIGGPGNDVIWGDRRPYPDNGPDQTDDLYGGTGDDWIYASHGTNHIDAGPGDDHVFAYFGHGTIDCGPGYDVLTLSRSTEHAYTYTGCEVVRIGFP
jgi:Ca2+-binding RTX toxin-like protein